jgi:hypothetical protein
MPNASASSQLSRPPLHRGRAVIRHRLVSGCLATLAFLAVVLVALAPGAGARGRSGCPRVVVTVGNRTFVADRFSAYQQVGCGHAVAIAKSFVRQGHSLGACTQGCRVDYRWMCFYEGLKDRSGYSHDCFSYPQYPAVALGIHPGPGFFFYERAHSG